MSSLAKRAVVLRRGPTDWTRMILWDLKTDHFIPGQWIAARVYERKCDLSPDGMRFIYSARGGGKDMKRGDSAYTGISFPPDFTAHSFWRFGTTYGGGGLFLDNRTFWCAGVTCATADRVERGLKQVENHTPSGPAPTQRERRFDLIHWRLVRDGWDVAGPAYTKQRNGWTLEKTFDHLAEHHLLHHASGSVIDGDDWEWSDFDGDDLLYAAEGSLWRMPLPSRPRGNAGLPPPQRLAVLSEMVPSPLSR